MVILCFNVLKMNITTCKICKKVYGEQYSLRRHIKKCHPGKLEELAPLNRPKPKCLYEYECDKCHRHFSHSRNLTHHKKKSHGESGEQTSSGLACILCRSNPETEVFTENGLIEHFRIKHDVNIIKNLLSFATFEEFKTWKMQEESKTNGLFINLHGTFKNGKVHNTHYICHRSGHYKSKGQQIRHLKTQGSKKIDGYCPAKIDVKIIDEKFEVQYISTHVGHSTDLSHLSLNETERQTLAIQIAAKIPFEKILGKVRESVNGTLERCHLLTKKDLSNIERSLNLNSEARRHCNDALSVDAWVKEVESTGCVKLKGLRARHKESKTLNVTSVIENAKGWMVPSSSTHDLYEIEERQAHCNCKLACTHCKKCIHSYSCSCLDSSIKWNMCKHIHLLCRFLKTDNVHVSNGHDQISRNSAEIPYLTIDENMDTKEEIPIVTALSGSRSYENDDKFITDKDKFKLELLQIVDSLENFEELDTVKKAVAPVVPTLTALRDFKNKEVCKKIGKNIPHNKNTSQQRRLFKTKKTACTKKKVIQTK